MVDAADAAAVGEEYERLRERVATGPGPWWPLGRGVLAGRGMAAWLRARRPGSDPAASAAAVQVIGPGPAMPPEAQAAAVVQVLADIALAHLARARPETDRGAGGDRPA